jgi:hypothetical protein
VSEITDIPDVVEAIETHYQPISPEELAMAMNQVLKSRSET